MVKAEGKGGGRLVDKLEIQRIEQLRYVSRGRRGWVVGGIAHELRLSTSKRGEASILRGYGIEEGEGRVDESRGESRGRMQFRANFR